MLGHALADVFSNHPIVRSSTQLLLWDRNDLDIADRSVVEPAVAKAKPDILINAAAYTDVDGAEKERDLAMRVNAEGVGNLSDACVKHGVSMVHYSTDYVFDGKNPDGYQEGDVPQNPVNFYGRSKLAGEELFLSPFSARGGSVLGGEHFEHGTLNFYLIRTSWLYGPHGKNFPLSMIERVRRGQKEFSVVNDQHGRPTYTHDVALETFTLLNLKRPSGIYHVTNAVVDDTAGQKVPSVTWYDFATELFDQAAAYDPIFRTVRVVPCTSDAFVRPAARPAYSVLVNTKFPLLRLWQEALSEYLSRYIFSA